MKPNQIHDILYGRPSNKDSKTHIAKNALMMFIIFAIPKTLDYAPYALVFGNNAQCNHIKFLENAKFKLLYIFLIKKYFKINPFVYIAQIVEECNNTYYGSRRYLLSTIYLTILIIKLPVWIRT